MLLSAVTETAQERGQGWAAAAACPVLIECPFLAVDLRNELKDVVEGVGMGDEGMGTNMWGGRNSRDLVETVERRVVAEMRVKR